MIIKCVLYPPGHAKEADIRFVPEMTDQHKNYPTPTQFSQMPTFVLEYLIF